MHKIPLILSFAPYGRPQYIINTMKACFHKSRMQSTRLCSSASQIFHLLTCLSELASCQRKSHQRSSVVQILPLGFLSMLRHGLPIHLYFRCASLGVRLEKGPHCTQIVFYSLDSPIERLIHWCFTRVLRSLGFQFPLYRGLAPLPKFDSAIETWFPLNTLRQPRF